MPRIALITAFALLASPALAQGTPKAATAAASQPLVQLFISPMGEPFRAAKGDPYPSAAWLKGADTDGDGAIDKAEFMADAERFFKVLDKNGDGVLDESEITFYETKIAPEVSFGITDAPTSPPPKHDYEQERNADGTPAEVIVDEPTRIGGEHENDWQRARNHLAARRGAGIFGFIDQPEPVRAADIHINFRVSHKDWLEAAATRFGQLDAKHTGKLTLETLPKTPFQELLEARKLVAKK